MGEFNSDDHYIYYWEQESLRRNGVAIMVSKRVWNAVLGCNSDRVPDELWAEVHDIVQEAGIKTIPKKKKRKKAKWFSE